jgi:hypothetical protein
MTIEFGVVYRFQNVLVVVVEPTRTFKHVVEYFLRSHMCECGVVGHISKCDMLVATQSCFIKFLNMKRLLVRYPGRV